MWAPPMRAASASAVSMRACCVGSQSTTFAPYRAMFRTLTPGVSRGTTTVHGTPLPCAAAARAAPWLPAL